MGPPCLGHQRVQQGVSEAEVVVYIPKPSAASTKRRGHLLTHTKAQNGPAIAQIKQVEGRGQRPLYGEALLLPQMSEAEFP